MSARCEPTKVGLAAEVAALLAQHQPMSCALHSDCAAGTKRPEPPKPVEAALVLRGLRAAADDATDQALRIGEHALRDYEDRHGVVFVAVPK